MLNYRSMSDVEELPLELIEFVFLLWPIFLDGNDIVAFNEDY